MARRRAGMPPGSTHGYTVQCESGEDGSIRAENVHAQKEVFRMDQDIPDMYCDGVQVMVSPFDLILQLTERHPALPLQGKQPESPRTIAYVRMSLEHAKVIAIMLRKVLKEHEDQQKGKINLHPQICEVMGISPEEDW
jgi:hypothetical protein